MQTRHKSFSEIYDLTGIRLLVKDKQACYAAIGIVHSLWNPLPGRFKDYISVPKSNGYQSLHTSVIGPDGRPLEIQIRTHKMHEIAEFGIAAHWHYKEADGANIKLFDSLADIEREDASLFMEELKVNLVDDEVYVFTPKGDIISMPRGSSVLDFAFRIHTELGLKCAGAKIADRLVSIRTHVKSGDQVQIITNASVKPSLNWLKFLKTSHARAKLRNWFRRQEVDFIPTESGKQPKQTAEATPEKDHHHPRLLKPRARAHPTVEWEGQTDLATKFAKCCAPLPGDKIKGFITKGEGSSMHKAECPSLKSLENNEATRDRVIVLRWSGIYDPFSVHIMIIGEDRAQLYLDMVAALTHAGANIISASARTYPNNRIENIFTVEIDSLVHLEDILSRLKKINGIIDAQRVLNQRKQASAD